MEGWRQKAGNGMTDSWQRGRLAGKGGLAGKVNEGWRGTVGEGTNAGEGCWQAGDDGWRGWSWRGWWARRATDRPSNTEHMREVLNIQIEKKELL